MPRKTRLSYKKNYERKRQAKTAVASSDTCISTISSTISDSVLSESDTCGKDLSSLDNDLSSSQQNSSEISSELLSPPHVNVYSLQDLYDNIPDMYRKKPWTDQTDSSQPLLLIRLCRFSDIPSSSALSLPLVVTHSVTVNSNLEWFLSIHNRKVTQESCSALSTIPINLTPLSFITLLHLLNTLNVCVGQTDETFVSMITAKKGVLKGRDGSPMAILDDYVPFQYNHHIITQTVRTVMCDLLVHKERCSSCQMYRATLRTAHRRWVHRNSEAVSDAGSHTNIRYMTTPEKKSKCVKLKKRAQIAEKEVSLLRQKIETMTEKQGEYVDSTFHSDLMQIMADKTPEIHSVYPEGSFKRIFWEQQLQAASAKNPCQVRWHPVIIRWCLNLKLLSSSAYHATRTAGFIKLPSERTLRDYTHYFTSKTGFQEEVAEQLYKEANVAVLPDNKIFCGLIFDEMKVRENLVYNKFTGEVVGFTSLGEVNDELLNLEQECSTDKYHPPVATHLLCLMVRGVFFKLDFPFAHFASDGITGELLFPIIWEAVSRIHNIGLSVVFITADGASPNRKFFRMHSKGKQLVYKTENPFTKKKSFIYFFSDPSHLIKTVRNCWSHSGFSGTRVMTRNSKFILWKHLKDLYNKVHDMAADSNGISLLPKLKYEHINLSSYSRMRVSLAAQVLSNSVADALAYFGDPETTETEFFVRQFDRFFDCLNVRSLSEWCEKRKPYLKPYTDIDDERFKWLENNFLTYIEDWVANCKATKFTASEKRKMYLSDETVEGLRITVKSFVEMTKYLLSFSTEEKPLFLLSERISQDPLENYFGKQRTRGGRSDNPCIKECLTNAVAIRAQKSMDLDAVRGNCRKKRCLEDSQMDIASLSKPLPKRRRLRKILK